MEINIGNKMKTNRVHEESNDRWEYVVCMSPNEEFTQVSLCSITMLNHTHLQLAIFVLY